jgi:hypothetical protein
MISNAGRVKLQEGLGKSFKAKPWWDGLVPPLFNLALEYM